MLNDQFDAAGDAGVARRDLGDEHDPLDRGSSDAAVIIGVA